MWPHPPIKLNSIYSMKHIHTFCICLILYLDSHCFFHLQCFSFSFSCGHQMVKEKTLIVLLKCVLLHPLLSLISSFSPPPSSLTACHVSDSFVSLALQFCILLYILSNNAQISTVLLHLKTINWICTVIVRVLQRKRIDRIYK